MRPEIKVCVGQGLDPSFVYGTTHTAHAMITNTTPVSFDFVGELYLCIEKVATSGLVPFTLAGGQQSTVDFTITMPNLVGTWNVYLDIWVGTDLVASYVATEPVTVVVEPDIDILPIVWD